MWALPGFTAKHTMWDVLIIYMERNCFHVTDYAAMVRYNHDSRDYIFTLRIDLSLTIVVAFS